MAAEKWPAVRELADLPVSDREALDARGVPVVAQAGVPGTIRSAGSKVAVTIKL
jgi:hypothetical protein